MKKLILALMVFPVASKVYGQRYMGVATGNWAGMTNIYLNPANIADARAKIVIDLAAVNLTGDNDVIKLNTSALGTGLPDAGSIGLQPGQKMNLFLTGEVRLPGIMVSVKKNSFAITTRGRFTTQFANFDRQVFDLVTNPPASVADPVSLTTRDFNATIHAWSEIRFTYAREVLSKGDHFLKAGLTLSRLGGIIFTGFRGSLDGTYNPTDLSLKATNTDLTMASSVYSSANELASGFGKNISSLFGSKSGHGFGFDVGAVYEYRPGGGPNPDDPGSNNYKLRASVALTDVGSVKYDAATAHVTANGTLRADEMKDNVGNFEDFKTYAKSRGFSVDTGIRSHKVVLPTALIIGADYMISSKFYVNATYAMNLVNRSANFGTSIYNQLTLTPRFDSKLWSVGLPIGINSMSGFKAGIGFRIGGFFTGSDDLFGLLGGARGVNVYFGGYVPLHKRHARSN